MQQPPNTYGPTQVNQQLFATPEQLAAGEPQGFNWVCPFCHQPGVTQSTSKIPLLVMKDTMTFCPHCKVKINNY